MKKKQFWIFFSIGTLVLSGGLFFLVFKNNFFQATKQATFDKTTEAAVKVDCAKKLGVFSSYLFGNATKQNYAVAGSLGFTLNSVGATPPPQGINDYFDVTKYDFSAMDKEIADIFRAKMEPMVIFDSTEVDAGGRRTKPKNINAFISYVKIVATHLNNTDWPDKQRIRLIRFSNEPDNIDFWSGSQLDFFETYASFAKTIKTVNASFVLDTPGIMLIKKVTENTLNAKTAVASIADEEINPWITNFLSYAEKNNVPVDIFSLHNYGPVVYTFYDDFRLVREEVSKYPQLSPLYGTPHIGNDEWNIKLGDLWSGGYSRQFDLAWTASQNIAVLINMIEQQLFLSTPITGVDSGMGKFAGHDFLLTNRNGEGKPSYYAFKGFNQLSGANQLETTGTDHMNFAVISGEKENEIVIVISNYDITTYLNKFEQKSISNNGQTLPNLNWNEYDKYVSKYGIPKIYNSYKLIVNNLPWKSSEQISYERYVVDDNKKLEMEESKIIAGNNTLTFQKKINSPSVEIIKLRKK